MVYISVVCYALAKLCYCIASSLELASGALEHHLGNPKVPDQAFILVVLVVFRLRRVAAVWAITVGILATCSVQRESQTTLYILGHVGGFSAILSR